MSPSDFVQPLLCLGLVLAVAAPLGWVCYGLLAGCWRVPGETVLFRLAGVDPTVGASWRGWAAALLWFNGLGILVVAGLLLAQGWLPGNPQGLPGTSWHLALNTAVSFATNTNWQSYGGETTLSYLSQALGLTVQNFLSAATGIAVIGACARGFTRAGTTDLGNPWVDLTRITLGLLLPLSVVFALVLVWQGVPQTWQGAATAHTLEGDVQTIALGPAAGVSIGPQDILGCSSQRNVYFADPSKIASVDPDTLPGDHDAADPYDLAITIHARRNCLKA